MFQGCFLKGCFKCTGTVMRTRVPVCDPASRLMTCSFDSFSMKCFLQTIDTSSCVKGFGCLLVTISVQYVSLTKDLTKERF